MRWIMVDVNKVTLYGGPGKKEVVPVAILSVPMVNRPNHKLRNDSTDAALRMYTDWIDGNVLPYKPGGHAIMSYLGHRRRAWTS